MDRNQLTCLNQNCPFYGKLGEGNIGIHSYADKRYYCTHCKERFNVRQDTIFYRLHTDEEKVLLVLKLLIERVSLRGISRALGIKRDTVTRLLIRAAEHTKEVTEYLLRDLNISQAQIDELWSFVGKKRSHSKQSSSGQRQGRRIHLALH